VKGRFRQFAGAQLLKRHVQRGFIRSFGSSFKKIGQRQNHLRIRIENDSSERFVFSPPGIPPVPVLLKRRVGILFNELTDGGNKRVSSWIASGNRRSGPED